jgi:hypothetical protein
MTLQPRQTKVRRYAPERGAILIQVAVAIIVLIAFTMFVVDYGILWVSRRQAQNAADAGAMAGAIALAFDDFSDRSDTGPAKTAAHTLATSNEIWEEPPDVNLATDVTFPACPDDGSNTCIRVDVYRNQARLNPLPMWFGQLVGLTDQGVKATAIAQAAAANASDCLKPFAIPDKWLDIHDETPVIDVETWTTDDTFDKHADRQGTEPLPNPDYYRAPKTNGPDDTGTGFTLDPDKGTLLTLKAGGPQDSIAPGFFFPVRLPREDGDSTGGDDYRDNIATCNGVPIEIGQLMENEPGNMIGPTFQGMADLIALDPDATWNETDEVIENSCAQAANPCAPTSPRLVAVPVFDTGVYYDGKINGLVTLRIANILGFFMNSIQGNQVTGYFTTIPGLTVGTGGTVPTASSFMTSVVLVR